MGTKRKSLTWLSNFTVSVADRCVVNETAWLTTAAMEQAYTGGRGGGMEDDEEEGE